MGTMIEWIRYNDVEPEHNKEGFEYLVHTVIGKISNAYFYKDDGWYDIEGEEIISVTHYTKINNPFD